MTSLSTAAEQARVLAAAINGDFGGRSMLTGILQPSRQIRKLIQPLHSDGQREASDCGATAVSKLGLPAYRYGNSYVDALATHCKKAIASGLIDVLIQGSLGTGEQVPYSDFDAIALIHRDAFESEQILVATLRLLYDSRSIMYDMDFLQHHGWFVITDDMLTCYSETYLPIAVLQNSASLCQSVEMQVHAVAGQRSAFQRQFDSLCNSLEQELRARSHLSNWYQCKSFLSKLMLLPSFYIQARDGVGVFKKDSFGRAEKDFTPDAWKAVEVATELRWRWHYRNRRWASLRRRSDLIGKLSRKKLSGKLPSSIQEVISGRFETRLASFIAESRSLIECDR